jgi:hypothetical protein
MHYSTPLFGTICSLLLLMASVKAASPPIMKAHVPLPETNQPDSLWAASDTQLVYQLDNPRVHPPSCVSCGDPAFTDFRVTFYEVDLRASGSHLQTSPPRALFTLENGMHTALFSVVRG